MPRSELCDRCQRFSGYLGDGFLVCAVHPTGPAEIPCPDFAEVAGQVGLYADVLNRATQSRRLVKTLNDKDQAGIGQFEKLLMHRLR